MNDFGVTAQQVSLLRYALDSSSHLNRDVMRNLLSLPRRCFVLLLLSAIASPAAAGDGLADEARPDSWKSDAALTDVTFIDRQNGWAVGSHGVLLRTEDGGKTWTEGGIAQASACLLYTSPSPRDRG